MNQIVTTHSKPKMALRVKRKEAKRNFLNLHGLMGYIVIFLLLGGSTYWASVTEISGGVHASGKIVTEQGTKLVQHLEGGIVSDIFVLNQDEVSTNQPLLKFDDQRILAALDVTLLKLNESLALKQRLDAQTKNLATIQFPDVPDDWPNMAQLKEQVEKQQRILTTETEGDALLVQRLESQIEERGEQIAGF